MQVVAGVAGAFVIIATVLSAVRTVVVPRSDPVLLTSAVFAALRVVFRGVARLRSGWAWTDRAWAMYAPLALLTLPLLWLTFVLAGTAALFWAVGEGDVPTSLELAGSSLLTLGFTKPTTVAGMVVAFAGAGLVLAIVVLLLVTYLPTMYASFSERERRVALLEARAGSPPEGVMLIVRLARIKGLGDLDWLWEQWEEWFATVQESHTTQPALAHFRSQRPDQHWVSAAGALLDAAALYVAAVDHTELRSQLAPAREFTDARGRRQVVRVPHAELCIRAGYLCLRDVARAFKLPYDPDPAPDDPIAVTREEFDAAWDRMVAAEVPLVADREAAWVAWRGWRVNYDRPLLELAALTVAPPAPWTSDRSPVTSTRPPSQ